MTTRHDAAAPKVTDGARGVRANRVVEQERAGGLAIDGDEHGERAVELGTSADGLGPSGIGGQRCHPRGLPDRDRLAGDDTTHAAPGHLLDLVGASRARARAPERPARSRRPPRGARPGRAMPPHAGARSGPGRRDDVGDDWSAGRERAGLVEQQHPTLGELLERSPPLTIDPRAAARDRPAVMAMGAARISGQGVATTRTATARTGSPESSQASAAAPTLTATNTTA